MSNDKKHFQNRSRCKRSEESRELVQAKARLRGEIEGEWSLGYHGAKTIEGVELHICKTTPREKGNTGILFLAGDLKKTYKDLKSKVVKFTVELVDHGWGPYKMFKDLYGKVFWLMEE